MPDLIIGLTGGVASGKSAASRQFQALGITVADADDAARDAVAVGSAGLAAVVDAFGAGVLDAQGALDRAAMRERVFSDEAARRTLEGMVHPQVRQLLKTRCQAAPGPYAVAAIPLLAEGGRAAYPWIHRVLVVDVPEAVQLQRLLARDDITEALARRMIAAQATRTQRLAIADEVVVNDADLDTLNAHVDALDRRYRAMASGG